MNSELLLGLQLIAIITASLSLISPMLYWVITHPVSLSSAK